MKLSRNDTSDDKENKRLGREKVVPHTTRIFTCTDRTRSEYISTSYLSNAKLSVINQSTPGGPLGLYNIHLLINCLCRQGVPH